MRYALSLLYGLAVRCRGEFYRSGLLKSHRLSHPVISVGNLTAGGTGKTPLVAFLAQGLLNAGLQPVILSRGYRGSAEHSTLLVSAGEGPLREASICGDEPYLLARKLRGVPILVGKERYQSGLAAEKRFANPLFILDDGYQHLQLQRDLDLLVLDATDPFGRRRLLPAGRLREPLSALRRADHIIVTRAHLPFDQEALEKQLRRWSPFAPVSYCYHDAVAVWDARTRQTYAMRDFAGRSTVALAGIGNPDVFLRDLEHYQIRVEDQLIYRDHHAYSQADLDRGFAKLAGSRADCLITTEKDAVRLERLSFEPGRVFALAIETRCEDAQEFLRSILRDLSAAKPGQRQTA
jgi:tetraacyldisaccharide 4'-kinase